MLFKEGFVEVFSGLAVFVHLAKHPSGCFVEQVVAAVEQKGCSFRYLVITIVADMLPGGNHGYSLLPKSVVGLYPFVHQRHFGVQHLIFADDFVGGEVNQVPVVDERM